MKRNVDISLALRQLLLQCHIFCSVDCCRANAFDISEGIIARWLGFERVDRTREIAAEIRRIKAHLDLNEGDIALTARGLESTWPLEEFKTFLDRLDVAFTLAIDEQRKTADLPSNMDHRQCRTRRSS